MSDLVIMGHINITYSMNADGHMITSVSTEGDLGLATELGMLRIAEDVILSMGGEDDDV